MKGNEKLGLRKVVYREGEQVRAITGDCVFIDEFLKVTNERGELLINKSNVLVIKNPGGQRE